MSRVRISFPAPMKKVGQRPTFFIGKSRRFEEKFYEFGSHTACGILPRLRGSGNGSLSFPAPRRGKANFARGRSFERPLCFGACRSLSRKVLRYFSGALLFVPAAPYPEKFCDTFREPFCLCLRLLIPKSSAILFGSLLPFLSYRAAKPRVYLALYLWIFFERAGDSKKNSMNLVRICPFDSFKG